MECRCRYYLRWDYRHHMCLRRASIVLDPPPQDICTLRARRPRNAPVPSAEDDGGRRAGAVARAASALEELAEEVHDHDEGRDGEDDRFNLEAGLE